MLALLLSEAICRQVEVSGCTPCSQISGAREYYSEQEVFCVCEDVSEMIQLIDGKLSCGEVAPGKVVDSTFKVVDSPCTGDNEYYDTVYHECIYCAQSFEIASDNGLCFNGDGVKLENGKPTCEFGFEAVYGDEHEFVQCKACPNGYFSIVAPGSSEYTCGACDSDELMIDRVCRNITNAACKLVMNEMVAGYRSCRCEDHTLPTFSLEDNKYICNESCKNANELFSGDWIPAEICHNNDTTLLNISCPDEYPLDKSTGLCACPEEHATAFVEGIDKLTCAPIQLKTWEFNTCNPSALLYVDNGLSQRLLCTMRDPMPYIRNHYSVCTQVESRDCRMCDIIGGTQSFTSELEIHCKCINPEEQIQVVSGELVCKPVAKGYYITPQFNKIKHSCADSNSYFNPTRLVCEKCDLPFQEHTENGLCIDQKGAYWVGNYSKCLLGFAQKFSEDGTFIGCEECPDDTYSIFKDEKEVCGVCKPNEFRFMSTCSAYTDEVCEEIVETSVAGYKRCRCSDFTLPGYSFKAQGFECGYHCKDGETVYTGQTIPAGICHLNGLTLLNTTCENEINETTGLCVCPEGHATTVQIYANGSHAEDAYCAKVLLNSSHVKLCNKDALFYYESAGKTQLHCAETGDVSIYDTVYRICTAVDTSICVPCNEIEGAHEILGANTVECRCTDIEEELEVIDGVIACGPVDSGFYYDQVSFNKLQTGCSYAEYFNPVSKKCSLCGEDYETRTENHFCIWPDGLYVVDGKPQCAQGFEGVIEAGKIACKRCPEGEHSIIDGNKTICGICPSFQHYYGEKCYFYDNKTCGSYGLQARFSKCVCPDGNLPLHQLETDIIECGECGPDSENVTYLGGPIPALVCRQKGMTIMNTSCPDAYPLDTVTGLCSCPPGYATVIRYTLDGKFMSQSTCQRLLISTYHTNNCNAHALFVYGHGGIEVALCAQNGNINIYEKYYEVCSVVDTVICSRCSEVPGAHPVYTEMQQFCFCDNNTHMIQIVDEELKCAEVPINFIADSTYNIVDNPCDNHGLDTYWDFKNKRCTDCSGSFKKELPNRLCEVPDGYEELSVYTRCFLGYEEEHSESGELSGCAKCSSEEYSIQTENGLQCGTCTEFEFRSNQQCVDFTDDNCKVLDLDKSMTLSHKKNQCLCPDGQLPIYGLKSRIFECKHCSEDTIEVNFNGAGIPSKLCREKEKTVLNTTCSTLNPLNEETGLCHCPAGQATVVNILQNGTTTNVSYCADILLDSYHTEHCNKGGLFVFEYKKTKTMFCMTHGDMSVFDVTEEPEDPEKKPTLTTGAIIGISVAVAGVVIAAVALTVYMLVFRKRRIESGVAGQKGPQLNQQLI